MADLLSRKKSKKICIIYAGDTMADDPAAYACERLKTVLEELGLTVSFWELKEENSEEIIRNVEVSAGVVLGYTVVWYGLGKQLSAFLDQCYGKKREDTFLEVPLFSVVFSKQGFEREVSAQIVTAWQLLGGWQGMEVTGRYAEKVELVSDFEAIELIEKKAEQFFRYGLTQKYQLPQSLFSAAKKQQPLSPNSSTKPVERQQREKENVMDLSNKLQEKLKQKAVNNAKTLPELIMQKYCGLADREYRLQILLKEKQDGVAVLVKPTGIYSYFGREEATDLTISVEEELLRKILEGKDSFQKGFMTGELTAKGDFNLLYQLDGFFSNNKTERKG